MKSFWWKVFDYFHIVVFIIWGALNGWFEFRGGKFFVVVGFLLVLLVFDGKFLESFW